MQVFKAFMKIIMKRITSPLIYIVIFLAISIAMTNSGQDTAEKYKEMKLDIVVIDLDDTKASQSLIDYLKNNHNVEVIDYDEEYILSNMYYQTKDYFLTINNGYMNNLENGNLDNLFTNYCIEDSYGSILGDNQVNKYISVVNSYLKGGSTIDEALEKTSTLVTEEVEVTMENFKAEGEKQSIFSGMLQFYFQYMAYILVAILVSALTPILMVLNKKEIRDRTNASCISITKQTAQTTLGCIIFSVAVWIVLMVAMYFMCKGEIFETEIYLAALNSFVFLIVALGIAMFASQVLKSEQATGIFSNIVALGMSFLCGVFVPQEYLDEGVITAAHFLPAFWFIRANNMLAGSGGEVFVKSEFAICIGMQLLFAAALFSLVFLFARIKRKSS